MKKAALRFILVLSLLMVPFQAEAYICCDPWGFVGRAAFIQAGTKMMLAVEKAATLLLLEISSHLYLTLENGFGRYTLETNRQTAYQRTFQQGQIAVNSALYMQERTGEAVENAVPAAQQSTTVTNSAMLGEQAGIVRQQISKADVDFMSSFYATKAVDASVVLNRHKPYCSDADVSMGRCSSAASDQMQNADLTINTIMNPGDSEYETMADEERAAAAAFVHNVVNPIPVVRLSSAQNQSQQAKEVDAELLADQAALSISAEVFNAEIALRTRRHAL